MLPLNFTQFGMCIFFEELLKRSQNTLCYGSVQVFNLWLFILA